MKNKKNIVLPLAAVLVVIVAVIVGVLVKNGKTPEETPQVGEGSTITSVLTEDTLEIDVSNLGTTAQYVDYNSDGTDMQVLVVRDTDGSVKVVYNTCQSCKGSPMAFFVQEGTQVVCQNCHIPHPVSGLGNEKEAGCNPIPMQYTLEGNTVKIPLSELDANASLFSNWKKGI